MERRTRVRANGKVEGEGEVKKVKETKVAVCFKAGRQSHKWLRSYYANAFYLWKAPLIPLLLTTYPLRCYEFCVVLLPCTVSSRSERLYSVR